MSVYRQPDPPPPVPPDPPDADLVRMEKAARRRARILRWGPYAGMGLLVGIVWIGLGPVLGILSAIAAALLLVAGRFLERLREIQTKVWAAILIASFGLWMWSTFDEFAGGMAVISATLLSWTFSSRMKRIQSGVPRPPAVIQPPRVRAANATKVRVARNESPAAEVVEAETSESQANAKKDVSV
jgi:hypothetical protein